MPFNIEQFKSQGLSFGGARPSLFEIRLTDWPRAIPATPRKLSFLAKASSLPPSVVESIDIPYFGRKIKILGDRVFPNWSVTVMNEEDFNVRNSLLNWHEHMNSKVPNILHQTDGSISEYKKNVSVIQYDKAGSISYTCTLVGAFPVTIDAIQLDWDAINQIEQFDVEFAYDYWVPGQYDGRAPDGPIFETGITGE